MFKFIYGSVFALALTACSFSQVKPTDFSERNPANASQFSLRVSPRTAFFEIDNGSLNTIYRSKSPLRDWEKPINDVGRSFSVEQNDAEDFTLFSGSLPDGIYRLTVGRDITDRVSQILMTIQSGQIKSTNSGDPRFPGLFKIENAK